MHDMLRESLPISINTQGYQVWLRYDVNAWNQIKNTMHVHVYLQNGEVRISFPPLSLRTDR